RTPCELGKWSELSVVRRWRCPTKELTPWSFERRRFLPRQILRGLAEEGFVLDRLGGGGRLRCRPCRFCLARLRFGLRLCSLGLFDHCRSWVGSLALRVGLLDSAGRWSRI